MSTKRIPSQQSGSGTSYSPSPKQPLPYPHHPGENPRVVDIVFPPDERKQIPVTTVFPWSRIGQIEVTFPSGAKGTATGELIGGALGRAVLTNAHVLYSAKHGGLATSVKFQLARNGGQFPYATVLGQKWVVADGYKTAGLSSPMFTSGQLEEADHGNRKFDYGLIFLQAAPDPLGGSLPLVHLDSKELLDRTVNITGYPGDKPAGTMWGAKGPIKKLNRDLLFYTISTYNGQSGSPILTNLMADKDQILVEVGLHSGFSAAEDMNVGVRITEEVILQIKEWVEGFFADNP